MPATPPAIFAPPSTPSPAAAGAVHAAPAATPTAPGAVHVVPVIGVATLTVSPAGVDSSVTYTAVAAGTAGNAITVGYTAPAAQATTDVAVAGNAISITPGTKARMVVTGTFVDNLGNGVTFPPLPYVGLSLGYPKYFSGSAGVTESYRIESNGSQWYLSKYSAAGALVFEKRATVTASPESAAGWGAGTGTASGTSVAAATSSAGQVIAAVNAYASAAALVTASAAGTATVAVAYAAATNLTGGGLAAPTVITP